MNAYQIGKVRYQNFGPFEDVTMDFARPGLTVIDGYVADSFGCDSNGAGKSFLFDGVAWALFGRCLRERYTADDVRRHTWKASSERNVVPRETWTCVTVELTTGDDTVSIARYRKHPIFKDHVRLVLNGEDRSRGTTPETTKAIESAIGMDFNAFCNSVAFAAREDIKSFLSAGANDTERKRVLEKILGLELFGVAQKVARGKLDVLTNIDLANLTAEETRLETVLQEKRAQLDEVDPDAASDLTREIKLATIALRKLDAAITAKEAEEARITAEQREEEAKAKKVREAYRQQRARYREQRDALLDKQNGASRAASRLRGQKEPYESQIQKTRALDGESCPTCQKTLTTAHVAKIVAGLTEAIEALEREAQVYDAVAAGAQTELDALGSEPERPNDQTPEVTALAAERLDVGGELALLRRRTAALAERQESLVARRDDQHDRRAQVEADVREIETTLHQIQEALRTKRLHAEMLEFWVEGFGNRGLKSFLIEAETPRINALATRMAQRLLGPGTRIRLNATKELKTRDATREQITIDAVIPGMTNTYAGASRAQKKRLDLALVLAFRDVVASRAVKGFRQLFADEIFDGMDESGVSTAGDVLRDLAADCPVAVISHAPEVQALANWHVTVHHAEGVATLREAQGVIPGEATGGGLRDATRPAYHSKRKKPLRTTGASQPSRETRKRDKRKAKG